MNTGDAEIRPARASDAEAIRTIYGLVVASSATSFEENVPSRQEIVRRMTSPPRMPWLVAVDGGHVVGYAHASPHRARPAYRWSAECSVYVAEPHRGTGMGRRLYERLIPELRGLGYASVFAGIALPNPASVRLHERLGFRPIGVFPNVGFKFGNWHDVGWWSLSLHAMPPAQPSEPLEWSVAPSLDTPGS
jgi:L-amino acid N-acyltransferase YncA